MFISELDFYYLCLIYWPSQVRKKHFFSKNLCHLVKNLKRILFKCFLSTTCIVMYVTRLFLIHEYHFIVLSVFKELRMFCRKKGSGSESDVPDKKHKTRSRKNEGKWIRKTINYPLYIMYRARYSNTVIHPKIWYIN